MKLETFVADRWAPRYQAPEFRWPLGTVARAVRRLTKLGGLHHVAFQATIVA